MPSSPECPTAETLAAFIDTEPERREKQALIAHLDGCARCRTVVSFAAEFEAFEASRTPSPSPHADSRATSRSPWVFRFAIAGGVTFVILVTLWSMSSFERVATIEELSTEAVVSPLLTGATLSSLAEHRFRAQANSFGFSAGPTREQLAFRIGVQLVDFRVCLEARRLDESRAVLQALRSLSRGASGSERISDRLSRLESSLSEGDPKEELELLDQELAAALDPRALGFGRWAEAGRLAAVSRESRYFADPDFRRVLSELTSEQRSSPVTQALEGIANTCASSPLSESDLTELGEDFRQLILLH